ADFPYPVWAAMREPGDPMEQRQRAVRAVLSQPPEATPGTQYLYSNGGYMIVGAALERRAGASWEALMRTRLFDRLAMASCGFGPPARDKTRVDQPWGHIVSSTGAVTPIS